jgi:hypothetical protein
LDFGTNFPGVNASVFGARRVRGVILTTLYASELTAVQVGSRMCVSAPMDAYDVGV